MSRFNRLVERQILKAQAEGKLQGLEGEGKPLPERPEEAMADAATLAGFRIMAEAGAIPEEIRLRKEADAIRAALADTADGATRKALMARLADVTMRQAIAEDARRKFLR